MKRFKDEVDETTVICGDMEGKSEVDETTVICIDSDG